VDHVVKCQIYHDQRIKVDAIVDGFTITGGRAESPGEDSGGGLLIVSGNLAVSNCRFEDNTAKSAGGAIHCEPRGAFVLSSSVLARNSALLGGAISIETSPGPEITALLWNSVIADNAAVQGAAFYCQTEVTDATFEQAPISIANCTIAENTADTGGRPPLSVAMYNLDCVVQVHNTILWNDQIPEINTVDPLILSIEFSDVQGGVDGIGESNIDQDPAFVDSIAEDFQLQSGSPCIDAASIDLAPPLDMDGNQRIDDPTAPNTGQGPPWADIGAHEHLPRQPPIVVTWKISP
jgi:predicted outer membrane repeat protein